MAQEIDILILSNAPGELATWVYPTVLALRSRLSEFDHPVRISVVLSPCSNASGQEAAIAQAFTGVDRVLPPELFWQFLLWGKLPDSSWDWRARGLVIFLGGDQFSTLAIAKRLGYKSLIYAEWEARWQGWIDGFAIRNDRVKIAPNYQAKAAIVGDLMVDRAKALAPVLEPNHLTKIAFMPGSKSMKLSQGVPLSLAIADLLQKALPDLEMSIVLAPTLTPQQLASYAQADNPIIPLVNGAIATLESAGEIYQLRTPQGTVVQIYQQFPADQFLQTCDLCVTTVGANTAELGALAVPMVVLLPTNQLDAMRSWDGLLGLIVNLPGMGTAIAKLVNRLMVGRLGLLAWPNIWAGKEIVPELRGQLMPAGITELLLQLLANPAQLQAMRDQLQATCGKPGAAHKIVDLAIALLHESLVGVINHTEI